MFRSTNADHATLFNPLLDRIKIKNQEREKQKEKCLCTICSIPNKKNREESKGIE